MGCLPRNARRGRSARGRLRLRAHGWRWALRVLLGQRIARLQRLPAERRLVLRVDGGVSTYFLTTFGRSPRVTVADCEATTDPSLSQALHLLNGSSVHNKINQGKFIDQLLKE